jgi:hypothetical protein
MAVHHDGVRRRPETYEKGETTDYTDFFIFSLCYFTAIFIAGKDCIKIESKGHHDISRDTPSQWFC